MKKKSYSLKPKQLLEWLDTNNIQLKRSLGVKKFSSTDLSLTNGEQNRFKA